MDSLRLFIAILFFVALFVMYISSTNTFHLNSESSLVDANTEKEFVVHTNKNTIEMDTLEENQENRQKISSYEQKTNHSYEQNDKKDEQVEKPNKEEGKLQPYHPEIFDSLQGSLL